MMAAREAVMAALFDKLSAIGGFVVTGRRLVDPENVGSDQRPALFVVEDGETIERPSPSLPAKRWLRVMALIYTDVGQDHDAIPSTQINEFIDKIEAALAPDDKIKNLMTLGGLVQWCVIDGDIIRAPGDVTGKSLAVIPIKILL